MKRDGCKVPFKSERIKEAILRAVKAAGVDDADYRATVAAEVVSSQNERTQSVDINEIQTAVENQLMSGPYKQLARAYIEYRHDRIIQRVRVVVWNREIAAPVEQTNPRCSMKTPTTKHTVSLPPSDLPGLLSPQTLAPASTCCRVT